MSDREFTFLFDSLDEIKNILNGDGYYSLEDQDSIREMRPFYNKAGNLIVSTYKKVKKTGFKSFFSFDYNEHSMLGDLVTFLESYYFIIEDYEDLYKVLVEDIPSIDKITFFVPSDTHINIYRHEIARYARKKKESKAWKIYNALIGLNNNCSIVIPKNLSTLEQLNELWVIEM